MLKEANEKITASAFDVERERRHRKEVNDLKLQLVQLEATLKVRVATVNWKLQSATLDLRVANITVNNGDLITHFVHFVTGMFFRGHILLLGIFYQG